MIVPATSANLRRAAELLRNGQLVAIPTETVYGLAADATNPDAVDRIYRAKGRPAGNPLIVHLGEVAAASRWVTTDRHDWLAEQWKAATTFWPGPLTVIVPRRAAIPERVTAGSEDVAVRIPDHPVTLDLLRLCEFPIAAPSANRSNYISPTTAAHVADSLGERCAMILDGGPCRCGVESTIVKLSPGGPILLRPGGIATSELQAAFGTPVQLMEPDARVSSGSGPSMAGSAVPAMPAPGLFARHYSPDKPLAILGPDMGAAGDPGCGLIAMRRPAPQIRRNYRQVWTLSDTGDLEEIARNLYAVLREADRSDCQSLAIEACPEQGLGHAIMDRIRRATGAGS